MNTRKHLLIAAMMFALTACSGGGSSSDGSEPDIIDNLNPGTPADDVDSGTPGDDDEDPGIPGGGDVDPGTPGDDDEDPGTPGGGVVDPGTPGDGDVDPGTPGDGDVDPGTPGDGDVDPGTPGDGDVDPGTPGEEPIAALCDVNYVAASAPQGDIVGGTLSSVRRGVVTIQEWNGSEWSKPLDTTTTDDHGRFAFSSVGELNGPVRFNLSGNLLSRLRCESPTGCGSAEPGEYYFMPLGYKLNAIVSSEELKRTGTVALSPATDMAAQWAMDMPKGITPEALALSTARVQALFGLDDDYATSLPVHMADCAAMGNASPGDQNHAIVAAAFAGVAEEEGYLLGLMVEGAAQIYSLLGGQILTGSGEVTKQDIRTLLAQYPQYSDAAQSVLAFIPFNSLSVAGLDRLMVSAAEVVRGLETGGALSSASGNDVRARLAALVSKWDGRLVTNLVESTTAYNAEDFATGKGLLDIYNGYRQDALLAEAGIEAANRNLGWLFMDEQATAHTEGVIATLSDALNWAVEGSICVVVRSTKLTTTCSLPLLGYNSPIDGDSRITLPRNTSTLRLQGTWESNQTVNLQIGVQDIRDLLQQGQMTIRLNGSISNATASVNFTNLAINLTIPKEENDLGPFQKLSVVDFANSEILGPLLENLAAHLNIRIGLTGKFSIASTNPSIGTYTVEGMDTFLDFKRQVITKGQDAPILAYGSKASTTNPAGETEEPVASGQMFSLVLDDPLTLHTAYRFQNLGLPPMELEAGGELFGYEEIVATLTDYITTLLDANPDSTEIDYSEVYEELQTLFGGMDFTALALNGNNELRIYPDSGEVLTYALTTQPDGGVSITNGTTGDIQAALYIRGTAGYVYTNDTLVAVANFGDKSEGLLVSQLDGTQRAYRSEVREDEKVLQAATWKLLESLFQSLFKAE